MKERRRDPRPEFVEQGKKHLSPVERLQIRLIRRSFRPGRVDGGIRWCQRHIGATWIHHFTDRLLHLHGLENLPPLEDKRSIICVCNHRSFFDLYVVTAQLVRRGLPHRILFPVRSQFFYDSPLGFFVNGVMSFFAMYPPIFRERKRASLNLLSLAELSWLLEEGGMFVGIHPEGTRKKDDDPYTFLPPQPGVGRVIHRARSAVVVPVFVNGLINDLRRQVASNFDGTGREIHVVFGKSLELSDLRQRPASPRLFREISQRCLAEISQLGEQERLFRGKRGSLTLEA